MMFKISQRIIRAGEILEISWECENCEVQELVIQTGAKKSVLPIEPPEQRKSSCLQLERRLSSASVPWRTARRMSVPNGYGWGMPNHSMMSLNMWIIPSGAARKNSSVSRNWGGTCFHRRNKGCTSPYWCWHFTCSFSLIILPFLCCSFMGLSSILFIDYIKCKNKISWNLNPSFYLFYF